MTQKLEERARKLAKLLEPHLGDAEWYTEETAVETIVGWLAGALAACALETSKPLIEAATALLAKLDEIERDTSGIFVMAHVHGMPYKGPNWAEEYKAMRTTLERAAEGK